MIFSHLNPWISALSLLVGFVGALRWYGKDEKSSWFSWILIIWLGGFFTRLYFIQNDQIYITDVNNYGDLTMHIHMIRGLARGLPFWPENPIFALDKMRYPFGINMFNALWESLSVPTDLHLAVVGFVSSFILFRIGRQTLGLFGVLALIASGGWAVDSWTSTSGVDWKNIFLAALVTQRGLLFALPCGLYLIFQALQLRQGKIFFFKDWLRFNILLGSLGFFHLHSFFILSLALILIWIPWPQLFKSLPGFLLGGLFALNTVWGGTAMESSLRVVSFWTWDPTKNSLFDYLWMNFHFWPWVLGATALMLLRRQTWTICILLVLTGLSFKIMLAPWAWDQIKILIWIYIFWLLMIRQLTWPGSFVKFMLAVVLLWPGLQQLQQARQAAPIALMDNNSVQQYQAMVQNIRVQDRVLAAPVFNHPLHWSGQAVVIGFDGHVWSQGLNPALILQKMDSIFLAQGNWRQAAKEVGAKYLLWGQNEQRRYSVLAPQIQQLPVVAKTSVGELYELDSD